MVLVNQPPVVQPHIGGAQSPASASALQPMFLHQQQVGSSQPSSSTPQPTANQMVQHAQLLAQQQAQLQA
jgi:predicted cobalt transporter CbtA